MANLLQMFDGITPKAMPHGAQLYASYVDGNWPNFSQLAALFPGTGLVAIAVDPVHDANVLDCENGDARPDQCPAWTTRQRGNGRDGTIYCNQATWPQVRAAFNAVRIALPPWWGANYNGQAVLLDDPQCVGHQFASYPNYDDSVVLASWAAQFLPAPPPVPVPPAPPAPIREDSQVIISLTVDKSMTGAPSGTPWPGEVWLFESAGKYVHIEPGAGAVDNASALSVGGVINGGTITYAQHLDFVAAFGFATQLPAS